MTTDSGVTLRADARRNRAQIIAAARTIFAEAGPDVPMDELARAAGVGVGTLYRRFPDRDALIRAVAVDSFARVLADARVAAETEPTAWQALAWMLGQSVELQVVVRLAMLSGRAAGLLRTDPELLELRHQMDAVFSDLVARAQAEGTLRADVSAADITVLFGSLLRQLVPDAGELSELATRRSLGILLDGLRAESGHPLPGRPLTVEELRG